MNPDDIREALIEYASGESDWEREDVETFLKDLTNEVLTILFSAPQAGDMNTSDGLGA